MHYLGIIIASVFGYLIGSISFSIIIVFLKTKGDVRSQGSNNAGATNASRVIGKSWGLFISFLDAIKVVVTGFFAVGLSMINNNLFSDTSYFIPMLFAVIGHCFPIYYKFKGGKAVSTFIGLIVMCNWLNFFIFAFVWWTLIFIWRKVSLSSITATIVIIICAWIPWIYGTSTFDLTWLTYSQNAYSDGHVYFTWVNHLHSHQSVNFAPHYFDGYVTIAIVITLSSLLLIFKHRQNIERLINKTEKELSFKKHDQNITKNFTHENVTKKEPPTDNTENKRKEKPS
ncbi:glycerol-3-phosphate 1-O-acyltransferase PlsY [Spiroplasma endosymbiont of Labia minor]|uniref:glycerol-3-phosphate 1-O-acyltransferase PlsY n=1 Tax=Spiroplasma endosymbiont of Labia minor TaxID=3066305 RepID=UPI0030CB87D1